MSSTSTRAPYGMYYDKTSYFGGTKPPGFDGAFSDSVTFVSNLSTVKALGARAYIRVTTDPRNSADSNSKFSLGLWKARMDAAATHGSAAQMNAFAADGTLGGHMLIDDAQAGSSYFPGGVPTGLEVDQMAQYSKSYWSGVPCGVRMLGTYMKTIAPASGYTYLDFAWAQWVERFGAAQPFYQNNVNDARSVKLGCMAAFNMLNGGSGITPPWNQHPSQAIRFGMSPQEIDACGNAFSALTTMIGIIGWAHEPCGGCGSTYHDLPSIQTALENAFNKAIGRAAGPINWQASGSTSGSTRTLGGGWGLKLGGNYRSTGPTLPIPLPDDLEAEDLMGILLYSRDSIQRSVTVPSGWSEAARVSGNSAQGGELTLIYKIASGGETSQSVTFAGAGGTGTSIMGASFAASGNSTIQGMVLSTVGSDSSWGKGSSNMGPVKGGFTSAASDALVLIGAAKTAGFSTTGGDASPGALSATTSDGETWNRLFTLTGTSGDDCGMFLDYAALQGQPSITTKSWTQLTGVTSLTSGAGCGFMVSFVPVRVQAGVAPSITDLEDITLSINSTLSFALASAGSTPITWSLTSGPSNVTLGSSTGQFTWTPLSQGSYVILVKATNSIGSDTEDFVVTVASGGGGAGNVAPVITHPGNQTVSAGERLSFVISATDADNDPITFSLTASAPAGTFIDPVTGQFVWVPTGAQGPGVYPIAAAAFDGQNTSLSTFTVTVTDTPWTRLGGPTTQLGRVNPTGNSFRRL